MKKSTKGAIAAGAAGVLLLGGVGSLAFWTDSVNIGGGDITAGELKLTEVDAGTWTLNGASVADINAILVVPGDEVAFSASYDIIATGDNLEAIVTVVGADATGDLLAEMPATVTKTINGNPVAGITDDNNGETIAVVATFDFDFVAATNDSQTDAIDLSDVAITLTQTDATP